MCCCVVFGLCLVISCFISSLSSFTIISLMMRELVAYFVFCVPRLFLAMPFFVAFSMGSNQYWAGRVYDLCVYYDGNSRRLTESGFMEKPGIEPATPGLQGIALIHYTTGACHALGCFWVFECVIS